MELAALLEQRVQIELSIATSKWEEAKGGGYGTRVITAFNNRRESLDEARQLLSQLRSTLYYCQ
jgi:hypothetical protein